MLHKICLLGFFIFAVGCMKLQKKNEPKNETRPEVEVVQSNQVQPNQVQTDELDFDYSDNGEIVQFHFPNHWPQQVIVEKYRGSEKIFNQAVSSLNSGWKTAAAQKEKVGYKFFAKVDDQNFLLDEIEIIPLLDLTLNQDYNLDEIYTITDKIKKIQFRQLSLNRNAKIFIGSFKGKLQIAQLNSQNGFIQTFPFGQRASEKNGRNVGGFELDIQAAVGNLNLALIAESGAHGLPGAPPNERLMGAVGIVGEPAQFVQRPGDSCAGMAMCIPHLIYDCSKAPGAGKQGGAGLRGYPGADGGNGGSVEKVNLKFPSSFQIEIQRTAGEKGQGAEGGAGGAGGPGGLGGDGAKKDFYKFLKIDPVSPTAAYRLEGLGQTCTEAPQGPTGPQGIQGTHGRDGINGVIY